MNAKIEALAAVMCVLTVPSLAQEQVPFADSYADAIESLLENHFSNGNGAMVIGLIDEHGSRVFSGGKLGNGSGKEVDGDTIFEIGSVTKVFTALLLLDSVRRDEVKLNDPVAQYLPKRVKVPSFEGKQITLQNLAAQDSGLPWHPDNLTKVKEPTLVELRDAANAYTVEDLYRFLSEYRLANSPGTTFQYSNAGMALLGHAIELKTGSDYESLVVDRICQPLAMHSTRITLIDDQKTRLARGHWADGTPGENVKFQAQKPAGSLLSTGNDLLKFLEANLGFGDSHLTPIMKQSLVIRHTDHVRFGKTAMPWFDERMYNPPGTEILAHGGGGYGYLAFIGLEKRQRRGVVVLTSQMAISPYGIGWTLLQGMPLTHENITYWVRETVGLGFALDVDEESSLPRITTVWPASPAGKAGLKPGCAIATINGTSVRGKSLQECLRMMAGRSGTTVRLEVFQANEDDTTTWDLTHKKFLRVTGVSSEE